MMPTISVSPAVSSTRARDTSVTVRSSSSSSPTWKRAFQPGAEAIEEIRRFMRASLSLPDAMLPEMTTDLRTRAVSAEAARRFLVARHFLAPPRSLRGGTDAVLQIFDKLGSIQFDPLAIAGRTHDLMLHARVAEYDPSWCDQLYERREIFEAYNKGLSFVRTREFPWFRVTARGAVQTIDENRDVAERVLERIRAEGPLSALDFERVLRTTTDWFGMPTNTVRAVLEALTLAGALGLARRDGNRRYYDVLERLLPADVLAVEIPWKEQLCHKLLSRYRAHGLLGVSGAADVFSGIGPARPHPKSPGHPGRNALREELVERGELVAVAVEGVRGKRYV